jgi:hypothetical protein
LSNLMSKEFFKTKSTSIFLKIYNFIKNFSFKAVFASSNDIFFSLLSYLLFNLTYNFYKISEEQTILEHNYTGFFYLNKSLSSVEYENNFALTQNYDNIFTYEHNFNFVNLFTMYLCIYTVFIGLKKINFFKFFTITSKLRLDLILVYIITHIILLVTTISVISIIILIAPLFLTILLIYSFIPSPTRKSLNYFIQYYWNLFKNALEVFLKWTTKSTYTNAPYLTDNKPHQIYIVYSFSIFTVNFYFSYVHFINLWLQEKLNHIVINMNFKMIELVFFKFFLTPLCLFWRPIIKRWSYIGIFFKTRTLDKMINNNNINHLTINHTKFNTDTKVMTNYRSLEEYKVDCVNASAE